MEREEIILFKGKNSPLSNLNILEDGLVYKYHKFNCSEQAYQWEKAIYNGKPSIAKRILQETDSYKQMKIGRTIDTNSDWKKNKKDFMREILKFKLINSPRYREALIQSEDKPIVEDTTNEFWGRGKRNTGLNTLGQLHCELRLALI